MSNPITAIEHGIEVAAVDIVHGVENVVTIGSKVIKLIEDGKAMTPLFKQELSTIISDAEAIAKAAAPAVVTGGANVGVDLGVMEPVVSATIQLAKDFTSFLPALEAAMKQIGADLK